MSNNLIQLLNQKYNFIDPQVTELKVDTHFVYKVTEKSENYALKIYRRPKSEVEWEIELLLHLLDDSLPVVKPVKSEDSFVQVVSHRGNLAPCVLYHWVEGQKPQDSLDVYYKLGQTAARIHSSADNFSSKFTRDAYDADYLVTEQFRRIKHLITSLDLSKEVGQLEYKLMQDLASTRLDFGVCHMDLKPDNVHIKDGEILVFDFDSAVESWRAIEPYRILDLGQDFFQKWLKGYRTIRDFNQVDEMAVETFQIIGELRNAVWHLGYAESSIGEPTMTKDNLKELIHKWLDSAQIASTN
jgi:Ser/Thr protein kinase RdoA (MazF antagonist)